jgi:hypothetical protein
MNILDDLYHEKVKRSGSDKLSANHKQEFAVEAMFLSDQNE